MRPSMAAVPAVALCVLAVVCTAAAGGEHLVVVLLVAAVIGLPFPMAGAVVLRHAPGNRVGKTLVAIGTLEAVSLLGSSYGDLSVARFASGLPLDAEFRWVAEWSWLPALLLVVTVLLLWFPDGHPPSPRWRPFALLAFVAVASVPLLAYAELWPFREDLLHHRPVPDNSGGPFLLLLGSASVSAVGSVSSLVVRFRRSSGAEVAQLKWFMFGWLLAAVGVASAFVEPIPDELNRVLLAGGLLSVPICIGVAVNRHRLYEIDRLLSRTVSYLLIMVVLAVTYLAGILLVGGTIRALTGHDSDLTVAISTLSVAALFQPARRRIRAVVDRRFNRRTTDASRLIALFGRRVRDDVELGSLVIDLRAVTQISLAPTTVQVWLRGESSPARTPG